VIGAGAAGLHCAAMAGQLDLRVAVIDHAETVGEKIRISGGGRCNFTNRDTSPAQFISRNPDFCRSALARYTPADFIALVERHGIAWHEKHRGQLFCDGSSTQIVEMLLAECDSGGVERWQPCDVDQLAVVDDRFLLSTSRGPLSSAKVVVATGGLSIPKIGASDFGYRLARQFGHRIVETRPALVPLLLADDGQAAWSGLAGVSLPVRITTGVGRSKAEFTEDLLFTHRGLSGPAALQISSYWQPGEPVAIDLLPDRYARATFREAKRASTRGAGPVLADLLPRRFAEAWLAARPEWHDRKLAESRDREIDTLAESLHRWSVRPSGTEGYRKAEVTVGGVDTRELDSRSFESRRVPGLHFIGEVVDVTGWLGGYNFQWAWASAAACARALGPVCERPRPGL